MAAGTFDPQMRERARELYDEGHGCNAIAKLLGVSPSTVSRWAKSEALMFDRDQTALAVRAHVLDMADARLLMVKKMQAIALETLDTLDGEYLVYSFGGKDNTYEQHVLDTPPIEVVRSAMVTAGIAFDKATKVLSETVGGSLASVSLIDTLEAGMTAMVAAARGETTTTDAE